MRALEDLRAAARSGRSGQQCQLEELEIYVKIGGLDAIQERFSMLDREIEAQLLPVTTAKAWQRSAIRLSLWGLLSGLDRAGTRLFR